MELEPIPVSDWSSGVIKVLTPRWTTTQVGCTVIAQIDCLPADTPRRMRQFVTAEQNYQPVDAALAKLQQRNRKRARRAAAESNRKIEASETAHRSSG